MVESPSPKAHKVAQNGATSATQASGSQASKGPIPTQKPPGKPAPKAILVIGPRGSGKTSFINMAGCKPGMAVSKGLEPCTLQFCDTVVRIDSHEFRLIDSPGFDNTQLDDCDIFTQLVQYFVPQPPHTRELTGIIYVHRRGDNLSSGTLARNICALKALIGEHCLSMVTVLALPALSDAPNSFARSLLLPHSPFHQLKGAKFQAFKSEKQVVFKVLLAYGSKQPVFFDAQKRVLDGEIEDIKTYVQNSLLPKRSPPLRATPNEWESEQERLQQVITERTMEANDLRNQLQQTQTEYVSLRSHLQIKENIEQGQVAQQLVDLNRQIDDLGHAISNYLVDLHHQAGATSLNAHQLPELKAMFLHTNGLSSLVESSAGTGMAAPDFFDYAVRSILCEQLYKRIFRPFHPSIPESDSLSKVYPRIQSQEPQVSAGRWRKSSFNSICHLVGHTGIEQIKSKVAEAILSDCLNPLLKYYFGPSAGVALQQRHRVLLEALVSSAWEWNEFLKGSVVLLGDFRPVAYRYGDAFDPERMSEFEARRDDKTPKHILSTIGLGMVLAHARGEGNAPEMSVICKASVATEKVFR